MTRVIAGSARGRQLRVPPAGTRPTSDRVREAMFSTLEARSGGLNGLRVLDLYAGSGALGLEALSRGAAEVVLVESARPAARVLQQNVDAVGLPGVRIVTDTVQRYLGEESRIAFDVVLADPPYSVGEEALTAMLTQLADGWLGAGAIVVVERPKGSRMLWPEPLQALADRRYGDTVLWYGRAA